MELCSRCHKRVAVVFISRLDENNKPVNEGICLKCARELGISQVNDIISKMGLSEDDIDKMAEDMTDMLSLEESDEGGDEADNGRAPALDISKFLGGARGFMPGHTMGQNKSEAEAGKDNKGKPEHKKKFLSQYCTNLNEKAKKGEIDGIVGRDREIERLIHILSRRQKNNPCLIGEPGVGKTAIAEALAQRIVDGNVPFKLQNKEIYLLDLTSLVAGTQFRGQFETRIKGLIEEVRVLGNVILMIDEIHNIVGAGDAEGSMSAANILKPALSRGEIQVIGATTLNEYRKHIEKDSALERRFQPIIVEESNIEDSIDILKGIKKYYEAYHGVTIPDGILRATVTMSERYITDRFLPDKAIDLLDEAAAFLALSSPIISEYQKSSAELETVKKEREALEAEESKDEKSAEEKYAKLAEYKSKELKLEGVISEIEAKKKDVILDISHLAHVIEIWTGIPASNISESEFEKLDKLEDRIKTHIVGQDEAVGATVRAIKRNRAGVSPKKKPVSFIFAGPTGVGKTELVKTIANELFNSPETLIRLDMSEFMEKHSVSRIIGAPPGYVGYDEAGQLTEKIRRKPYSVILFDEIEKAHPDVLNILLQILDDGRITDAHGKTVNFENAVIIMTTNAGSNLNTNALGFSAIKNSAQSGKTEKALLDFLRPEFLNRVDEVITFNPLTEENFREIAKIMLGELKASLEEKSIAFNYSDDVIGYVAKNSFSTKYGARNMRRFVQTEIEDAAANLIIENYSLGIKEITAYIDEEGKLKVKTEKTEA